MKILSLFDGISCARVALERAGIKVDAYCASEVDKYAIQISQKNFPDIVQLGDVKDLTGLREPFANVGYSNRNRININIDLLIGGSPCQDLSIAKKNRKGLDGERSGLFWEYVRILNEVKPKYFILENVNSMPKEAKDLITKTLGVEPIMINASLVSAQNRKRLFWTNIPNVTLPEDKGIMLKDILECGTNTNELITFRHRIKEPVRITRTGKSPTILSAWGTGGNNVPYVVALTEKRTEEAKKLRSEYMKRTGKDFSPRRMKELVPRDDQKANTITTGATKESLLLLPQGIRKLTPIECERLQGLPDNYTDGVSNTQRYKCLGNAFNVDVVAHILSFIK